LAKLQEKLRCGTFFRLSKAEESECSAIDSATRGISLAGDAHNLNRAGGVTSHSL
jgi:hypothetical protein